jgi:hypothetical protein
MNTICIFSIHDRDGPVLAFDLKHILQALGPLLDGWIWYVDGLDTVGGNSWPACPNGSWVSSGELTRLASEITQTIDGTFIAFPAELGMRNTSTADLSESAFPTSRAKLMILAVDSSFFEVYAKDPAVIELIRPRFMDVREVDPKVWF